MWHGQHFWAASRTERPLKISSRNGYFDPAELKKEILSQFDDDWDDDEDAEAVPEAVASAEIADWKLHARCAVALQYCKSVI